MCGMDPKAFETCRGEDAGNALDEAGLARVLEPFALGEVVAARQIEQGFVNENYVVETGRGRYFLKRRHPSLRQAEVIRAQHALVGWLSRGGFPAPTLVPKASDGDTLLVLDGQYYEVQEYIEGTPYDHGQPAHLAEAGTVLARYHRLVEPFDSPVLSGGALYGLRTLRANLRGIARVWRLDRDAALIESFRRLTDHADDLAARFSRHGPLPQLIIHGDYYAGNLLFDGDRIVGVVDYDKASLQPRVAELAEALIYFASPRPGYLQHLVYPGVLCWRPFAGFLRAYSEVVALSEREISALPDYVRCIWLQISLQRLLEAKPRLATEEAVLQEVLTLGDWANDNAARMADIARSVERRAR
jgi:homoserine kinase type II